MRKSCFLLLVFLSTGTGWFATDAHSGTANPVLNYQLEVLVNPDVNPLRQQYKLDKDDVNSEHLADSIWTSFSANWFSPTPEEVSPLTIIICTREPIAFTDETMEEHGLTKVGESYKSGMNTEKALHVRRFIDNQPVHVKQVIPPTPQSLFLSRGCQWSQRQLQPSGSCRARCILHSL